jgi:hypothetical protein
MSHAQLSELTTLELCALLSLYDGFAGLPSDALESAVQKILGVVRIRELAAGRLASALDDARGGKRLQIVRESGGDRHYIGESAIHAGDPIAAFIEGQWRRGRYEANWTGDRLSSAWFYFDDELRDDRCCVKLTSDTPVLESLP